MNRKKISIAFLGDFVTTNSRTIPIGYFDSFKEKIKKDLIYSCINLESPVVDKGMKRIKEKVTLKCVKDDISILKEFNPYVINLANNHINDYGNVSVSYTKKILEKEKLNFFGVGYSHESQEKVFIDSEFKIISLFYCTRSSDFTGSKLFAEDNFIGVWDINFSEIEKIRKNYIDYTIIVNVHWGIENIVYPEVEKCKLGRKIIDSGADAVIGHHPHIIQPYEKYKGKYIFYSLGNFFFPEVEFELHGEKRTLNILPHQKKGIVPIFTIINGTLELNQILMVENTKKKQIIHYNYKAICVKTNTFYYYLKSKIYYLNFRYMSKIILNLELLLIDPKKICIKILRRIKR